MARIVLALSILLPGSLVAVSAEPVVVPRHAVAPQREYWLSTNLNQLVFWRTPGVETHSRSERLVGKRAM
jgi:hypothetical protein